MATTYLSKTNPSSASTSLYKGTVSWWQKGTGGYIFGAETGSERMLVNFANTFNMYLRGSSGSPDIDYSLSPAPQFRDPSAWRHCVLAWDTTLATAGDRIKLYVNNEQFTVTGTATTPQNHEMPINKASMPLVWGAYSTSAGYFDGVMSHCHFVDGQQLTPSTFGETDSTSGIWKPKTAPSVTHGNYGFFLKFENSGAMGTDSSGNSNTFTVSGNLTQNVDTPSNNFATLNALSRQVAAQMASSPTNGNTTLTSGSGSAWGTLLSTIGESSGKYYCEAKVSALGSYAHAGICDMSVDNQNSSSAWELGEPASSAQYGYYSGNGNIYTNASNSSYGNTFTTGDIIGIAMDLDNSKLYFSKNGTWQNSGDPTSGATGTGAVSITADKTYGFAFAGYASTTWNANFGSGYFSTSSVASAGTAPSEGGIFEYDCPSGYQALCTKGINSF